MNFIKPPRVAIVILNWNGQKMLEKFLPSVLQTQYPNFEVYVADNASTDNSVEYLSQHFETVKIIQNHKNYGFAEGYNVAFQQVTDADYWVLLNSDVEVTPTWLQFLVQYMEKNKQTAACMPKLLSYTEPQNFEYAGAAGGFIDTLGYAFCRGRIFDVCEADLGQYNTSTPIFWATGAALCVRPYVYRLLGGLDARFFAHMEEIDWCWRAKNAGYSIAYCPQAVAYHVGGGTLPKSNPHKTFLNFRNNAVMILKNENLFKLIFIAPLRLLLDVLAGIQFLKKGEWGNAKAVFKAIFFVIKNFKTVLLQRQNAQNQVQTARVGAPNKDGILRGSIVFEYFIKNKKFFSELRI